MRHQGLERDNPWRKWAWKTSLQWVKQPVNFTIFIASYQQPGKFRYNLLHAIRRSLFPLPTTTTTKRSQTQVKFSYSHKEDIPWSAPWRVSEISAAWQSGRHPLHPHFSIALSKHWGRRILLFDQPQHWSRKKRTNIRATLIQTIRHSN